MERKQVDGRNWLLWFLLLTIVVSIVLAGTVFEAKIQQFYPSFDGITFIIMMLLLLFGVGYGVLERSMLVIVATFVAMLFVPTFKRYFVEYLPVFKQMLGHF